MEAPQLIINGWLVSLAVGSAQTLHIQQLSGQCNTLGINCIAVDHNDLCINN